MSLKKTANLNLAPFKLVSISSNILERRGSNVSFFLGHPVFSHP